MADKSIAPTRVTIDPKTVRLAQEAMQTFNRLDAFGSIRDSLRGFETIKLADLTGLRQAMKSFESVKPADMAGLSEALKRMNTTHVADFGKALSELNLNALALPRLSQAVIGLRLPHEYTARMAEAFRELPSLPSTSDLVPYTVEAIRRAATIAESPSATEIVKDAFDDDLDALSPMERGELQLEITAAIAALGTVVGMLLRDEEIQLASAILALVVVLVSIHRRLGL